MCVCSPGGAGARAKTSRAERAVGLASGTERRLRVHRTNTRTKIERFVRSKKRGPKPPRDDTDKRALALLKKQCVPGGVSVGTEVFYADERKFQGEGHWGLKLHTFIYSIRWFIFGGPGSVKLFALTSLHILACVFG